MLTVVERETNIVEGNAIDNWDFSDKFSSRSIWAQRHEMRVVTEEVRSREAADLCETANTSDGDVDVFEAQPAAAGSEGLVEVDDERVDCGALRAVEGEGVGGHEREAGLVDGGVVGGAQTDDLALLVAGAGTDCDGPHCQASVIDGGDDGVHCLLADDDDAAFAGSVDLRRGKATGGPLLCGCATLLVDAVQDEVLEVQQRAVGEADGEGGDVRGGASAGVLEEVVEGGGELERVRDSRRALDGNQLLLLKFRLSEQDGEIQKVSFDVCESCNQSILEDNRIF